MKHASPADKTALAADSAGRSAALEMHYLPLSALTPAPYNPRVMPPSEMDALVRSLTEFGCVDPILVRASDRMVVGGHQRLEAARHIGLDTVPVIELDLDENQAQALNVALNNIGGEWDIPKLAELLDALPTDLAALTGFDEAALKRVAREAEAMIQAATAATAGEDDVPQPPAEPIAKRGDLWVLGSHRLLCGDSTNSDDLRRLMDGESAALLATDPPYCVDYTGADRPAHAGMATGKDWSHVYNEVDIEDLGVFLNDVFGAALPHTRADAAIYVWHAHRQFPTIAQVFDRHELLLHQPIVWVKPTATFTHAYYAWRHEPCAFGWKRGHKPPHPVERQETTWFVDWEGKKRIVGNEHPTQKPLELFARPMRAHTMPGDVCLEPFSGSGSQIIAAERLGRRCFAVELQPAFVDVAVQRWEKVTGGKAERQR